MSDEVVSGHPAYSVRDGRRWLRGVAWTFERSRRTRYATEVEAMIARARVAQYDPRLRRAQIVPEPDEP